MLPSFHPGSASRSMASLIGWMRLSGHVCLITSRTRLSSMLTLGVNVLKGFAQRRLMPPVMRRF